MRPSPWPEILLLVSVFALARVLAGCTLPPAPVEPDGTVDCRGANAVIEELGGCGILPACNAGGDCRTWLESCEALESDMPGIVNLECLVTATSCEGVLSCATP